MKLSFIIVSVILISGQVLLASSGSGQSLEKIKVTVELHNQTLKEAMRQIEKQTSLRFAYKASLPLADKLNVASEESVAQILEQLFSKNGIAYRQVANNIILFEKEENLSDDTGTDSKAVSITGLVTDETGKPLPGATVHVKGTTTGTQTDPEGRYKITTAESNPVLVFSFIGYVSQELVANGRTTVDVQLKPSANSLNEVVVVGYGSMKKKDLTGSIISVRPDRIANENPKTVQDILRGTPGMTVGFDPSAKGGGTQQIRGQRSVYTSNGHNDPLLILDGMIFYGELSEINPDDIDQIDVLKDASAAAVYGAKSANGVIIISTKKGKMGKPVINFSGNIAASAMGANRKVWDPEGYMQYRHDWYIAPTYGVNATTGAYEPYKSASATQPGFYDKPTPDILSKYGITVDQWRAYSSNTAGASDDQIWAQRLGLQYTTLNNYLAGKTFDWYDHSFRVGKNQDYNVSASGASDKINYYMSLGYLSNQGVVVGDNYRSVRSNLKVSGKIAKWLEIGTNVNFQDRSDGGMPVDWGQQITSNSPFANYTDSNGNLVVHPMGDDFSANKGYNYDFNLQYRAQESGYTVLNTIFNLKATLPFNITYSFNAAPRYQFFYNRYFESSEHPDWIPTTHGVTREQSKRFDWSLNNTLNWEHVFAQKHRVNVTLVQEAEERKYWYDEIIAKNLLPTDALGFHETSVGDKMYSSFDSNDSHETADGLLARIFYSFDDRYMLTTSFRRDGYSAFGTSNPRANFFSTGFAWNFKNEKFFKWEPLSTGKLRLSYGQNGNRSLADPYVALANLSRGAGATQGYLDANGNYIQLNYLYVDRLPNTHLKWERTSAYNAGVDFGFFKDRITGSFDYYFMPTSDMIMSQSLPGFSGFTSITTNLGEVQNQGFEIIINSQNLKTRNFSWNSTIGFSKYKNTIKHLYYTYQTVLDANGNVVSSKEVDDVSNGWFIGQPISAIWNYRVTGIWQANEAAEAAKYGQRPGDPKVANNYTADDATTGAVLPVYNNNDKEFLGQTSPPIMWSFRNDFAYRNFTLSLNMYSYWGHKSVSSAYLNQDNTTSQVTYNLNTYVKQYWTPDNPSNVVARLDAKGPVGVNAPPRLYDRSFIRLDNVSLGYIIPSRIISKAGFQKLRVYGSVRNVAVWKKDKNWTYWDIETGSIAPRIFTLGVNLTL